LVRYDESEESGKEGVKDEDFDALVSLLLNDKRLLEAAYYADTNSEADEQMAFEQQLQPLKVSLATPQGAIDQETLGANQAPVSHNKVALDECAKTDEEISQARGIVYVMLILLYVSVIVYGMMIAQDVATEKSSRVMEILISSVSP